MDGFKQIRSFYSWVFNNPDKARQSHISLYVFLINQNNRNMWVEWFKCPRDLAMAGACIGSNNTYYKVLDDLKNWNLLEYKKGINDFKAPMIKLKCLYTSEQLTAQVSAPLSAPLTAPLPAQLSVQLTAPIYKRITDNFKLINNNENYFINLLDNFIKDKTEIKTNNKKIPPFIEFRDYALQNKPLANIKDLKLKYDSWVANGWKDGHDKKILNWKSKILNTLPFIKESIDTPVDQYAAHMRNLTRA